MLFLRTANALSDGAKFKTSRGLRYKPDRFFLSGDGKAWTISCYDPMAEYERKHPGNPAVGSFLEKIKKGIAMYQRYEDYFGFVFHVGRKL